MKLVFDPEGTNLDIAAAPLAVEGQQANPARKRIDLVTARGVDGAVPFGKAASDVLEITYQLRVDERSTLDEALAVLRELSQLLDECEDQLPSGLPLEETPDGSELASTFDVLAGEIVELPREMAGEKLGWYHKAPFAEIRLICKSFYRGAEETAGEAEGEDPVLALTVEGVKGDVDAEPLAILTDKAEAAKRYAEVGLESRYFDPEDPAPLLIKAGGKAGEALDPEGLQGSEVEAPEGAHSSKVIEGELTKGAVAVCATGNQAHIGQWRETLRFWAETRDVYVRLAWRVGDGSWGRGSWVRAPVAEEWVEQFLESINIPEAAVGSQKWEGRIEAYTEGSTGEVLKIDYLENLPAERWVQVRAPEVGDPELSEGPNSPGTVESDASIGSVAWENPGNATTSDNTRASATGSESTFFITNYLKATNFGFALPEGAMVLGITAEVEKFHDAEEKRASDEAVRIVKAGVIGEEDKSAVGNWPLGESNEAYQSYGAGDDLWGETWTYSDINGSGFGVAIAADVAAEFGNKVTVYIDHIRITVFYNTTDSDVVCAASQDLRVDHETAERYDSAGTYVAPTPTYRGGGIWLPPAADRERSSRIVTKMRTNDVQAEASDLANSKHKLLLTYVPRYRFPRDS